MTKRSREESRLRLLSLGSVVLVLTLAGCGTVQGGAHQAHPQAAVQSKLSEVPSSLPSGLRASTVDQSSDELWVLTRADDGSAVQLDGYTRGKGFGASISLGAGETWLRGSVAVNAGTVWAAWGQSVVSVDGSSGVATTHKTPWSDGNDGREGRVVDMAVDSSGTLWVAVYGSALLYSLDIASGTWSTLPLPDGQNAGFGTRVLAVPGHVVVNTLAAGSSPEISSRDRLWLAGSDSALVNSASGVWAAVSVGSVTRFSPDGSSLGTTSFVDQSGGPAWNEPMSLGADTLWRMQRGTQQESLVAVSLTSGSETLTDLPLVFADVPVHGFGATSDEVEHLAVDPQVMAVSNDGAGSVWVVTSYAGGVPNSYPALWAVA